MENENFRKMMEEIEKPEISGLRHQDMIAEAVTNARDKSVVSIWWLSIPIFIILMLLMKSVYMPGTTLISNLHDLSSSDKYLSLIFFMISPVILIIINILTIRKVHFLSGNPKFLSFLHVVWSNMLIIALSLLILLIYSL
jgi:hypothetical protein